MLHCVVWCPILRNLCHLGVGLCSIVHYTTMHPLSLVSCGTKVTLHGHGLRPQVVVSTTHEFIAAASGRVAGGVLEKLEILTIVVADKRDRTTPAHDSCSAHGSGFVVLGQQCQAFVRLLPNEETK